jgi:hypothetical protein
MHTALVLTYTQPVGYPNTNLLSMSRKWNSNNRAKVQHSPIVDTLMVTNRNSVQGAKCLDFSRRRFSSFSWSGDTGDATHQRPSIWYHSAHGGLAMNMPANIGRRRYSTVFGYRVEKPECIVSWDDDMCGEDSFRTATQPNPLNVLNLAGLHMLRINLHGNLKLRCSDSNLIWSTVGF